MIQNENGIIDSSLLTKSIPTIESLLSNLSYSDLLMFITNITTGKDSKNLSIESRITLLDIALTYLQKENNEKAMDVISTFEDIHSHLDLILLSKKLWDPNLKEYISHEWVEELENIYGQEKEVPLNICSRMIVQGISPYLIYQTSVILQNRFKYMAMMKDEEPITETFDLLNIYTKTLDTIIMTKEVYPLRALNLTTSEALFEDILDWVIYTTISYDVQYLEDKKWHEKLENGIFEYLKNVIANTESDNSLSNDKRRKLIEIFNRQFQSKISENTNITNILQSSKIQCILRDNWNTERSVEELNDETKYIELIKYLLKNSQSISHINAITEILNEWMFNSPNNDEETVIKDTKEISETLKECWKLFMLWTIDHQYFQKLFYLRLKYIKYDLLGSKNEEEILTYLKKNKKNYIYYLQNLMLTKENSQIKSVIPEVKKLLDAEKNGKKKIMKKKRVSLQTQDSYSEMNFKSVDGWDVPKSSFNNNNNGWDVPKSSSSYTNKNDTSGWDIPKSSSSYTNKNDTNGWDIPKSNFNRTNKNYSNSWDVPKSSFGNTNKNDTNGWNIPKSSFNNKNDTNGWDVPKSSFSSTNTNTNKNEDINGWDVPLDLNIPLPNETKTENKTPNSADGWDVPLDLDIPIPEKSDPETKPQTNIDGWDVPMDLDIPIPKEPKPEITKPQSSVPQPSIPQPSIPQPSIPQPSIPQPSIPQPSIPQPSIPQPSVDGWDVPLDLDIPIPEEPKSEIKDQTNVNGWDVSLNDLNIPSLSKEEEKKLPIEENKEEKPVDGWDVPLNDFNIPSSLTEEEKKSPLDENKEEKPIDGWDVPLDDFNIPTSLTEKEKKSPIKENKEEKPVDGWDVSLDNLNIPTSLTEEEKKSPIKENKEEKPIDGWDVPLDDLNIPISLTEEEKKLPIEENKKEKPIDGWDVPLDDFNIPSSTEEKKSPFKENIEEKPADGWDIPMDMNNIPVTSTEIAPLSSSPKHDANGWNLNEELPIPEITPLIEADTKKDLPINTINNIPLEGNDDVMPLPEEYEKIMNSIKSNRNLHILICSRGYVQSFITSPLFGPLLQSVLTPLSLVQQSSQNTNHSMMNASHKFTEYHHLLGYVVASLVSSGFINEASRLVYFYMNGLDDSMDTEKSQEIHIGIMHRYKLLKSYLKKTHTKISRRIKTQTKDHDNSNMLLRLNDQPQSIENAIITEFVELNQIKKQLENAIDYINNALN